MDRGVDTNHPDLIKNYSLILYQLTWTKLKEVILLL
ncbi:hypothetical protein [Bacillus sp. UNC322MFChir4.1]